MFMFLPETFKRLAPEGGGVPAQPTISLIGRAGTSRSPECENSLR